jgi:polyferredoxin
MQLGNFFGFYEYVMGNAESVPYRPPVSEGFMPIAALVAFKAMFLTGGIDPIHPAGLVIFIVILLTAWIFRRALCSGICLLGTLSEYLGKLGKKAIGRNYQIPKWLDISLLVLKYAVIAYLLKSFILLPASEAAAFMQIPYYTISDIKMFEMFLNIGLKGTVFIIAMMLLSFLFKTFFCRYICPYGAVLGVKSIISPIIIRRNSANCIKCNHWHDVCPGMVNIMDKKNVVISSECIGCTSCVSVCPKPDALSFKALDMVPLAPMLFSLGFVVIFFSAIALAMATGHWDSVITMSEYKQLYSQMFVFKVFVM